MFHATRTSNPDDRSFSTTENTRQRLRSSAQFGWMILRIYFHSEALLLEILRRDALLTTEVGKSSRLTFRTRGEPRDSKARRLTYFGKAVQVCFWGLQLER